MMRDGGPDRLVGDVRRRGSDATAGEARRKEHRGEGERRVTAGHAAF